MISYMKSSSNKLKDNEISSYNWKEKFNKTASKIKNSLKGR